MTAPTDTAPIVEAVLVDTDVFSFYIKGDTQASQYDKHTKGKKWALSFATVGELLTWSKYKGWGPAKIAELERRIGLTGVIPYDMALCQTYAELNAHLLKAGKPVGDNDLWIAATAIRHSIPLIRTIASTTMKSLGWYCFLKHLRFLRLKWKSRT